MDWNKFKPMFDETWHEVMKPFIESEACDKLYAFLKAESMKGKKIAPLSKDTFRCFKETRMDEVKVVMIGMCPYHTFTSADVPIADGLLMGCTVTDVLQPSLDQFYDGIETELYNGLNLNMIKSTDVSYLSRQGVLMFNAALTTEKGKAGAHQEVWEPFIKYMFENVFNKMEVPIIYLGKEAERCSKYSKNPSLDFPVSHPASASYRQTKWNSEGVFKRVNELVWEKEQDTIAWFVEPPF